MFLMKKFKKQDLEYIGFKSFVNSDEAIDAAKKIIDSNEKLDAWVTEVFCVNGKIIDLIIWKNS